MSVLLRQFHRGLTVAKSSTIEHCLPTPAKAPPVGPGWIHEIKHDGSVSPLPSGTTIETVELDGFLVSHKPTKNWFGDVVAKQRVSERR
jgi:hypothetical protein